MNIIVGFCSFCEEAGLVSPAREEGATDVVFVCDECLAVYESLEALKTRTFRELKSRYTLLTEEEANAAGLGGHLLRFDANIKKWVPVSNAEVSDETLSSAPECASAPSDTVQPCTEDLEAIRNYLIKCNLRDIVITAVMKNFEHHGDIAAELAYRIREGAFPSPCVSVNVGGECFTAQSLMAKYKRFNALHEAYSYLAFLRDEPEEASKLLARGLPIKD